MYKETSLSVSRLSSNETLDMLRVVNILSTQIVRLTFQSNPLILTMSNLIEIIDRSFPFNFIYRTTNNNISHLS